MISCVLFSSLLTQSELPGTGPVSVSRQAVGRTLLTRPAQMDGFRHLFLSLSAYLWLGLDWKFNSLNIFCDTLVFFKDVRTLQRAGLTSPASSVPRVGSQPLL